MSKPLYVLHKPEQKLTIENNIGQFQLITIFYSINHNMIIDVGSLESLRSAQYRLKQQKIIN